ncbi:MAG: shikimate dehydrogenase [Gemmatimonadales bacterium]
MTTGRTRVFAILGDPVAHSLSPAMQGAAFLALGLDAVYVPMPCAAGQVGTVMAALVGGGGGGNVTVPHKKTAAACLVRSEAAVTETGACNTFYGRDGELSGDNTDIHGILTALDHLDAPPTGWLILGTGGSARAAVCAARRRGAMVAIRSRSIERRLELERWIVSTGTHLAMAEECEVVINATPLGLGSDDPLPLPLEELPPVSVALDLVYRPGGTRWVYELARRQIRAVDGREVLVAQGAAALERWFPDEHAPLEVMRAVVSAGLR